MPLFKWLFGKRQTHLQLGGPGKYSVRAVGESHYQRQLSRACGGPCEDGHNQPVVAVLFLEDENPYDPNAVRVEVAGKTVAYLGREDAKQYRQALAAAGYPRASAECQAMIVGGWDRGPEDRGHFGIRLDMPRHGEDV